MRFRWDSDEDARKPVPDTKKATRKPAKPFASVALKSRKIKIKKPTKARAPVETPSADPAPERLASSPAVTTDSRRVVVSSASERNADAPVPVKSPRVPRRSASELGEGALDPDRDGSEKALSNYAPSDIDDDVDVSRDKGDVRSEKAGKSRKESQDSRVGLWFVARSGGYDFRQN